MTQKKKAKSTMPTTATSSGCSTWIISRYTSRGIGVNVVRLDIQECIIDLYIIAIIAINKL